MFYRRHSTRLSSVDASAIRFSRILLLAGFLLLLLAALPGAQAQDGRCISTGGGRSLWEPSSGFIRGSIPTYPNSNCSPPSNGSFSTGPHGIAIAGSREEATAICNSRNGGGNFYATALRRAAWWSCKRHESSNGGSSGGGSGSSAWVYQRAPIHVSKLPMGSVMVYAELGMTSGIVFQRFDHYAVGVKSVADMGILDVVDVWGQANQKFEVCFPQAGNVVFLDAATSPRSLVRIPNFARDGYSCAAMNRAGTMVLVESKSEPSQTDQAIAKTFIDATNDPVSTAIELGECQVTPRHNLNLRDDPWGELLAVVRKGTTVVAIARTESWFKVIHVVANAEGADEETDEPATVEGWIAAWLSEADGDCAWASDRDDGPALADRFLEEDDQPSIA